MAPLASSLAASQLTRRPVAKAIGSVASRCQRWCGCWLRGGSGGRAGRGGVVKSACRNQRRSVAACGSGCSGNVAANSTRIRPAPQPGCARRSASAAACTRSASRGPGRPHAA
jgi:hypothetical protein